MPLIDGLTERVAHDLRARNELLHGFFAAEAERLAEACREMAARFLAGGRLLAFGRGPYATDAQHVSVEFVHPVIVGKQALPALDLSLQFQEAVEAMVRADDMAMGFGPPSGDPLVWATLRRARERGAMTFALPGRDASFAFEAATRDPFVHQELVEILYHTLWETVHVFFEHRKLGHDVGQAAFLYPFLGNTPEDAPQLVRQVAESIRGKVADDAALRVQLADHAAETIADTALAIRRRLSQGGTLLVFGNGGSATDANDLAIDCVAPPPGLRPVPAVSLSMEPATVTAIANDVGSDVIFLRQLVAHARPDDVAVAISTSGGSRNVILALAEARKRGLLTVALLGSDGGEIARGQLADFSIVVHSDYIPRIQEVQASVYHVLREAIGDAG
jgi:D-sedoheptulose 7-phosphate isomerase